MPRVLRWVHFVLIDSLTDPWDVYILMQSWILCCVNVWMQFCFMSCMFVLIQSNVNIIFNEISKNYFSNKIYLLSVFIKPMFVVKLFFSYYCIFVLGTNLQLVSFSKISKSHVLRFLQNFVLKAGSRNRNWKNHLP